MKKYLLAATLLMGTVATPAIAGSDEGIGEMAKASSDRKILYDASKISAAGGVLAAAVYVAGTALSVPIIGIAAPVIAGAGLTAGILYSVAKAEKESYMGTIIYNTGSTLIAGVCAKAAFTMVSDLFTK